MTNLDALPRPQVIEELEYEVVFQELLAFVRARFEAVGIDWDVGDLETDPCAILLQAFAYREILLRARTNDAARSNLLKFSERSDLDHLVAWLGVIRLEGETDERLKRRYQLATFGRSAGGPPERYKAVALAASVEVRDVAVWSEDDDPTVNMAVLSTIGNGDASPLLLRTVRQAVERKDIKVTSDRFNVMSAVRRVEDLFLRVRLAPDAPLSLLEEIGPHLQRAWVKQDLLGLDLDTSWIIATARLPGVTAIELPDMPLIIQALENEAIGLGNIKVELSGRGR